MRLDRRTDDLSRQIRVFGISVFSVSLWFHPYYM